MKSFWTWGPFIAVFLFSCIAAGTMDSPVGEQLQSAAGKGDSGFLSVKDAPIVSGLGYILSCQNDDGGFGTGSGTDSEIKATAMAAIALASLGEDPSSCVKNGTSPLDYLLENEEALYNLTNSEAHVGRYVVALTSSGLDPRDINGNDFVEILKGYCKPDGEIGTENYIWDDAWVIMGLAACNQSGSDEVKGAVDHLKGLQTGNGGWAWNEGAKGEDPDTTGIILCALIGGGEENSSDAVKNGLEYLRSEQNSDGGFSSLGSNAATDGWAIMAINAAGQSPRAWVKGSADPIGHLLSLQRESGSIWWKDDSEGFSFEWTTNGMIALTGGRMPPALKWIKG